jgi:hypothetical protein
MNEERLETLLSVYRYRGAMPDFRSVGPASSPARRAGRAPLHRIGWLAAAAAVLIAIVAITQWPPPNHWHTTAIVPRVLHSGDIVSTHDSQMQLRSRAVGVIDVGANTTLRLVGGNRFELASGMIHAKTTSPPGIFIVDTPRARATDLGCEYTLAVSPNGEGILRVTAGWVGLTREWAQSLVPRGAKAVIHSNGQLSPPIFEDAAPAFQQAVIRGDLKTALPLARRRDALTLINLFRFANEEERLMIYDRLNTLVPAPATVTRDALRYGNIGTVEPWWPDVMKASGVTSIKKKKRVDPRPPM